MHRGMIIPPKVSDLQVCRQIKAKHVNSNGERISSPDVFPSSTAGLWVFCYRAR